MMPVWYDCEEDILGIQIQTGRYWKTVQLKNRLLVDISKKGKILGLEIPHAKKLFSKPHQLLLQNVQIR